MRQLYKRLEVRVKKEIEHQNNCKSEESIQEPGVKKLAAADISDQ